MDYGHGCTDSLRVVDDWNVGNMADSGRCRNGGGDCVERMEEMNKWRIYVAGLQINVDGGGDFETLKKTGLFSKMEQVDYFRTCERDDMWIYKVEINGKPEIAVIKRTEREQKSTSYGYSPTWREPDGNRPKRPEGRRGEPTG